MKTPATNLAYLLPICLVATLGGLLFGYDTGVISGAIEPLTVRFALTDFMKGWASGCVLIGCAMGVLLVGQLSDRFGRKLAMFLAALMFLASAIGTALPNDIAVFIAFRIIGGIGIGIASVSTPMYIAEITPAHIRGRMVAVNQIAIVGGIATTAFINYFIAHAQGDPALPENQAWLINTGWRWMFGTGIVPAVLFALLLIPIPESPRWLIERRREDKARQILKKVGGAEFAKTEFDSIRAALSNEQGTWSELFSPRLRLPLFIGVALAILQQVTGINVFMYFGATIFKNMSASAGVDAGLLTQIIINGAGVLFTVIAIAIVDRLGRRPLMLIGALGMGYQPRGNGGHGASRRQSRCPKQLDAAVHHRLHRLLRPERRPSDMGHLVRNLSHRRARAGAGLGDVLPLDRRLCRDADLPNDGRQGFVVCGVFQSRLSVLHLHRVLCAAGAARLAARARNQRPLAGRYRTALVRPAMSTCSYEQ